MTLLRDGGQWPRVILARAGRYDVDGGLAAAERAGAWVAWRRAVGSLGPEGLIRLVEASGLRGRGGAGFPTGRKWRTVREQASIDRFAVANGYEADPGSSTDRILMELDPHGVVEGLALAAFAVGARHAHVAVRGEYTLAAARLRAAVDAAEEAGYLGSDVLGGGFELHVQVHEVRGAFVLGEETVLLRALENKRAQPDQRPPFPAQRGLWGEPTAVNNVATLAAVPWIVQNGADALKGIGLPDAPGTVLVQVTGAVRDPGVLEVPVGTPIGAVLDAAGGAIGRLKAILVGGPSGGFLPVAALPLPLTWERLEEAGAIMGSGQILAVDESACLVDLATLMTRYMNDEACGKTIPCRIGVKRLVEIGERFVAGRPRPQDPELLQDLAADVRDGGLCGHEMTAVNPLLTGMRYFLQEFEDHIVRSTCPAGVCQPLRVAAAPVA
jgi:NADH-quinone oxidoreductase subunit F